jgi:hypothetical protein
LKSTSDGMGSNFRSSTLFGMGLALLVSLALLISLGITGCTSDEPNVVGTALVTDQVDTVLVALGVEEITRYSALRVENPDILVHEQEVLYMGEQAGTRSGSLVANYDFDIPFSAAFPESLFTEENIQSVKFSLTKVDFYSAQVEGAKGQPVNLYYQVQKMEAPFLLADYENYPVQVPPEGVGPFLNSDFNVPNNSSEPRLPFYDANDLLGWITGKEKVGIIVTFGAGSDPGLVGYASRELTHYRELDNVAVGTIVAPNFEVTFVEYVGNNQVFLLGPYADSSSFEEVPDPPADVDSGFLLRTGLRSYPTLLFDLSGLPPHAFINRALLSVTNDTTVSFGNLSSISVLEWDEARFGDPFKTVELSELYDPSERYSFHLTGQNSLDPTLHTIIQFDVTQALLRVINNVYSGTRGFILAGGEDFLPEGGFISVNPDFYYREFRFMGTAAADPLHRPQLKITYSVVNDLDGGGQ